MDKSRILVFDSGVGGLNVFAALKKLFPEGDFFYLSDGANCPYGSKSQDALRALTIKALDGAGVGEYDAVVIACNTLSSILLDYLGRETGVPTVGVLPKAGLKGRTALFCTPATAASGYVRSRCSSYEVYPLESLAKEIEDNIFLTEKITPEGLPAGDFDNVILGCTHYLFLRNFFSSRYPRAKIYDGIDGAAAALRARIPAFRKKMTTCDNCITIDSRNFLGSDKKRNYEVFRAKFCKNEQIF